MVAEQLSADEGVSQLLVHGAGGRLQPGVATVGDRRVLYYVELNADRSPTVRQLASGHPRPGECRPRGRLHQGGSGPVPGVVSPASRRGPLGCPPTGPRRSHPARSTAGPGAHASGKPPPRVGPPPWRPASTPTTTAPARPRWCGSPRTRPTSRDAGGGRPAVHHAVRRRGILLGPTDSRRPVNVSQVGATSGPDGAAPPSPSGWVTTTSGRCSASTEGDRWGGRFGATGPDRRWRRVPDQGAGGAVSRSASR